MIRIRQLVKRDELFQLIDNPDIVKVEISHANTNRLKNKSLCDAHVYYRTEKKNECCDNAVLSILGACEKAIKDDAVKKFLSDSDHAYLNGIQQQKHTNFLKASMINKLLEIQKKYDLSLNISKQIRNLVNKYSHETNGKA
jgi:hypothetical protein